MNIFPCRINRYLAMAGIASRRKSEELLLAGRVSLNGKLLHQLSQKVDIHDEVHVDGKIISLAKKKFQYYMLNKPQGYVVSRRAQGNQRTIYKLLPPNLHSLNYAGRLDKNSHGLVILSDDGDFLHNITHAREEIKKYYHLSLDTISSGLLHKLKQGIWDDGEYLKIVDARVVSYTDNMIEIILHEGRKRHLRRMIRALGGKVLDLYRYRIGHLNIENKAMRLKEGSYQPFLPKWISVH